MRRRKVGLIMAANPFMKNVTLPLPELFGIAATRGMLGAGLALMLADRLSERTRRMLGIALMTIGVLTTAPFAMDVLKNRTGR
jgi:hypothetical protein